MTDEDMVTIDVIVATTHPLKAYSGIRLSRQVLEQLADALSTKSIPLMFQHDARRTATVGAVQAGVRERDDGEFEVWARMEVDAEAWAAYEAELAASGAPGGMSFAFGEPLGEIGDRVGSPITFELAADAHHFSDDQLLEAGAALGVAIPGRISRRYHLSFAPVALVVLDFIVQQGATVPAGMLASYAYDSVRRFFKRDGAQPSINLGVVEDGGGRRVTACIPSGTDPEVARRAIAAFEAVANARGIYEYDGDGGWRLVREDDGFG